MKDEQADGRSGTKRNTHSKVYKRRKERRRAKKDPECQREYKKYDGYVS